MKQNYLIATILMLFLLMQTTLENSSAPPIWVASSFFKAGTSKTIQDL